MRTAGRVYSRTRAPQVRSAWPPARSASTRLVLANRTSPPRRGGPVRQDPPGAGRPRRRPRRPHLGRTGPRIHPPGRPHPGRLRTPRAHRRPGRRPLRTHLGSGGEPPAADPHLEPQAARLVPAVPEPRRRRITARPADQHQPPGPHGRPVLPAPQAARARRLDTDPCRRVDLTTQGPTWGIT